MAVADTVGRIWWAFELVCDSCLTTSHPVDCWVWVRRTVEQPSVLRRGREGRALGDEYWGEVVGEGSWIHFKVKVCEVVLTGGCYKRQSHPIDGLSAHPVVVKAAWPFGLPSSS